MTDQIHIEALSFLTRIGVPDEERATPQRLTVNLTLYPIRDFSGLNDQIEATVDYAEVALAIETLAEERPRKLIETLAEEMAMLLLARYSLERVAIELRKYILPNTAYVAVRLERTRTF